MGQMGLNREFTEVARAAQRSLVAAACVALLLGCSVYDSSLTDRSQQLPTGTGSAAGSLSGAGGKSSTTDPTDGGAGTFTAGGGQAGAVASAGDSSVGDAGSAAGNGIGGVAGEGGAESGAGGTSAGTSATAGVGGSAGGGGAPLLELAQGKSVTASSQQAGNAAVAGNDGDETTRWCAADGSFPQWWRVDLGATHALTNVTVRFEHPERKYSYLIETSPNDAVYTQRATVNGTGAVQSVDFPPAVSARYLRITVTGAVNAVDANGTVHPTWASFFELALTGS